MWCNCRWFRDVQNIFYLGNKRKLIPLNHLERFFNSASVLMSSILRQLALDSISDYSNLFGPGNVNNYVRLLACVCVYVMCVCMYGMHIILDIYVCSLLLFLAL